MKITPAFFAAIALGFVAVSPAQANAASTIVEERGGQDRDDGKRDDQGKAREQMRAGNQLSLREIEKKVLPQMRGSEYLGPAYDATARAYRLKFIKQGRVTYVDVDARTGKIIKRSK